MRIIKTIIYLFTGFLAMQSLADSEAFVEASRIDKITRTYSRIDYLLQYKTLPIGSRVYVNSYNFADFSLMDADLGVDLNLPIAPKTKLFAGVSTSLFMSGGTEFNAAQGKEFNFSSLNGKIYFGLANKKISVLFNRDLYTTEALDYYYASKVEYKGKLTFLNTAAYVIYVDIFSGDYTEKAKEIGDMLGFGVKASLNFDKLRILDFKTFLELTGYLVSEGLKGSGKDAPMFIGKLGAELGLLAGISAYANLLVAKERSMTYGLNLGIRLDM